MPTRPCFPWIGGKANAAEALVNLFPSGSRMYLEVFLGAGSVFWNIPKTAFEQWVVNDINGNVVNFFTCLRDRHTEMMDLFRLMQHSREEFERQLNIIQGKCCCKCHGEIERAVAFFYTTKTAHNSMPRSKGNFRSGKDEVKSLWNGAFDLAPYAEHLRNVVVERMDFQALIERYDKPDALVFCDPPYVGVGDVLYEHPFTEADHVRLRDTLAKCTGKWLLTYNDDPLVRDLYKDYRILPAEWAYNATSGKTDNGDARRGRELVVLNYDPVASVPLFA